ncbi:hypothetical protein I3843_03G134200 [Carya illinoinensis]|nr:hypothetical protein I3843_03G134200 [Carya illinoinensis]KAG7987438.1 hypothetical protein I3843_03G134200 [Carya illinoinensis]
MSSQYPILGNRPIDQWKVTELKEELKRRKLTIKGLKDDLIRRLDEAIRIEMESAGNDVDNVLNSGTQPLVGARDVQSVPVAAETAKYLADHGGKKNKEPDKVVVQVDINDSVAALDQEKVEEAGFSGTDSGRVEEKLVVHTTAIETSAKVSEIVVSEVALSGQDLEKFETEKESRNSKPQLDNEGSTPQLGNEGSTPQLGNEGSTPQLGNEGYEGSTPLLGNEGSTPLLGNEGSTPQLGNEGYEGSTPLPGNEGSTPLLGNEGSTPQLGNEGYEGSTPLRGNEGYEGSTPLLGNEGSTPLLGNEGSTPQLGNEGYEGSTPLRGNEGSTPLHGIESLKTPESVKLDCSTPDNQVSEVSPIFGSQVKSDSISTDSVSINEKNELKDNVITDHVKLELDVVKPEMVVPSFSNVVPVGGESHPMDVEEPLENKTSDAEKDDNNATDADISKKIDGTDVGYSEKLNLDRSSGDDSMEEDVLEGKQIDWKYNSEEVNKSGVPIVKEESHAAVLGDSLSGEKRDVQVENESHRAATVEKRKLDDQAAANNEPIKRQRRWNSEGLKVPEPQSTNSTPNTTPKDAFQTTPKDTFQTTPKDNFQSTGLKRNLSRSDSTNSDSTPKERVVPPSQKAPSNSLRIDRFLRPFTLKAVQELLGKTGTVTNFWMDHIKTHCYVTVRLDFPTHYLVFTVAHFLRSVLGYKEGVAFLHFKAVSCCLSNVQRFY